MKLDVVQYMCDGCGRLTDFLDPDQQLPKGWTWGSSRFIHYCPDCSKSKNGESDGFNRDCLETFKNK